MKKIKYGNRKSQQENKELDSLKEGDEICQAVLDTLSDDYLNYINHLVKHSKTPLKNAPRHLNDQASSDQQYSRRQSQGEKACSNPPHQEFKIRHHSQSGPKRQEHPPFKPATFKNVTKEPEDQVPRKLSFQKQTIKARDKNIGDRRKKKKVEGLPPETILKNQQKTMSFTRNNYPFQPQFPQRQREHKMHPANGPLQHTQSIQDRKISQKYYTNYQQSSDTSNEKVSINEHIFNAGTSQRQSLFHPFINQIDNYLSHLESNPQSRMTSSYSFSRKSRGQQQREASKNRRKSKNNYFDAAEYGGLDIQQILKENLKLNKKVKTYEEKIEELEDEVSSHLISRDKHYKNKAAQLLKALTQASSKIHQQKDQINTMKSLLHSFGQKVKQIQHEQEDNQYVDEDISDSILRCMGSHPHQTSNKKNSKFRKGLESTMPRYDEERRYWRD